MPHGTTSCRLARPLDPARRRARGDGGGGRRPADPLLRSRRGASSGLAATAAEAARWRQCRVLEASRLLLALALAARRPARRRADPRRTARPWRARGGSPPCSSTSCGARRRCRSASPCRSEKRLRRLCEAMLDDPSRHASLEAWAGDAGRERANDRAPLPQRARHHLRPLARAGAARPRGAAGGAPHADGGDRRRARLRQPERVRRDGQALGRQLADAFLPRRGLSRSAPRSSAGTFPTIHADAATARPRHRAIRRLALASAGARTEDRAVHHSRARHERTPPPPRCQPCRRFASGVRRLPRGARLRPGDERAPQCRRLRSAGGRRRVRDRASSGQRRRPRADRRRRPAAPDRDRGRGSRRLSHPPDLAPARRRPAAEPADPDPRRPDPAQQHRPGRRLTAEGERPADDQALAFARRLRRHRAGGARRRAARRQHRRQRPGHGRRSQPGGRAHHRRQRPRDARRSRRRRRLGHPRRQRRRRRPGRASAEGHDRRLGAGATQRRRGADGQHRRQRRRPRL